MGQCTSKDKFKFDKLKYPCYCVLDKIVTGDRAKCLESWIYCVRTRANISSTFKNMEHDFYNLLQDMHLPECDNLRQTNCFIELISTIIHDKDVGKLRQYKMYNFGTIGQAMLIILKQYYSPKDWTNELHASWIRCYSDLMRNLLKL